MQEYDVALKLLLQGSARLTMLALTGGAVEKWLDIELPKVQNLRMDLLGETGGGGLCDLNHNFSVCFSRFHENRVKILRLNGFPYGMVVHIITIGGSGATITECQETVLF